MFGRTRSVACQRCASEAHRIWRGALVQIDGELVGETPATISIVPDALTLRVPKDFKR